MDYIHRIVFRPFQFKYICVGNCKAIKKSCRNANLLSTPNLIDNNHFFKILKDLDIEFYDSTKQLEPYPSKDKNEPESDVSPDYTASSHSVENTDLSTSDLGSLIPSNL